MGAKNFENLQNLAGQMLTKALMEIAYGSQIIVVETQTKDDYGRPLSVKTISLQPKGGGEPENKAPMAPGTGSVN